MPLLNYTTSVPSDKTVMQIQQILAKAGASAIMMDYNDSGQIIALSFKIKLQSADVAGVANELSFRLPCDPAPVMAVLSRQRVERRYRSEDQALRVSWRIVKDWVEAQLAIIETQMVTTAQAFLPYAINAEGRTLYEVVAEDPKLLLGGGNE